MQEVPILVGTLDEPASLFAIAQQTKVMVAMAGPYARLGTPIVEACIKGGCHYVDITAEVPWMLDMARKYEQAALDKGICLVHNCGFDSIPCDLTAFFTARFIQEELNRCVSKRFGLFSFTWRSTPSCIVLRLQLVADATRLFSDNSFWRLCPVV